MNSHRLDEEPLSRHDIGLHHRETATHASNAWGDADSLPRQYSHPQPSAGNGGGHGHGHGNHAPHPSARQRRSVRFWQRPGGGRAPSDGDDNDKYTKHGKKGRRDDKQYRFLFGALCLASCALGWAGRRAASPLPGPPRPLPSPRQALHHAVERWKPQTRRANERRPAKDTPATARNPLLLPRFDARRYLRWWEDNLREAAQRQRGQAHPQSFLIEGWHYPVAFRGFPSARQTHGPLRHRKNLDPDYGDIAYQSLKNAVAFARVIPGGGEEDAVVGAFDPDSVAPDHPLTRRKKQRRKPTGSHPSLDSNGRKILPANASFAEVSNHYDDDHVHVVRKADDGVTKDPRACASTAFSRLYFPTCNAFHEHNFGRVFDDPEVVVRPRPEHETYTKYLAHGYYRDVWIMEDGPWIWPVRYPKEKERPSQDYGVLDEERTAELVSKAYRSAAVKTLQMKHPYTPEHFEEVQIEAIIMERLTRSPRIMDLYGHCVFSTMVEVIPIEFEEVSVPGEGTMAREDVEKHNRDGVVPFNDFTVAEKLQFALEMAESLAELHGLVDGVVVHDDVQPCQWLRTADGHLKLGDFNRATIMQWDLIKGGYCRFNNGQAYAHYRAPEEYAVVNLNEQIDTFSFGNNLYGMLTGLWNFYETDDDGVDQKKLTDGKLPYIDPRYRDRSFGERKLVELLEKCWIYDPFERISMFDAVVFLKEAIRDNEARGGGH